MLAKMDCAKNVLKEFISFVYYFDCKNSWHFPSKFLDCFKQLADSHFLILPTIENLVPILPKNGSLSKKFSPYKKDASYIIGVHREFQVFQTLMQPICFKFICQNGEYEKKNKTFEKTFLVKKDPYIFNEVFAARFLQFSNGLLETNKFLSELDMVFPVFSIVQIMENMAIIEFVENHVLVDSVFVEELKQKHFEIYKNRE